jgi:membrane protein YqaA with SNARE-associated domain
MDALNEILLGYGYYGMFAAAFLAGSFFPFSSEVIFTALSLAGLDVWSLVIYSSVGNTLGGMFNYGVGLLGREDWVYRLFKVKEQRMAYVQSLIHKYGVWMGLLSWLPVLGSVITIAMGLLHINHYKSLLFIFVGKTLRYVVLGVILIYCS